MGHRAPAAAAARAAAIFVDGSPRAVHTPHPASQRTFTAAPRPTRLRPLAGAKLADRGLGELASASQYLEHTHAAGSWRTATQCEGPPRHGASVALLFRRRRPASGERRDRGAQVPRSPAASGAGPRPAAVL